MAKVVEVREERNQYLQSSQDEQRRDKGIPRVGLVGENVVEDMGGKEHGIVTLRLF